MNNDHSTDTVTVAWPKLYHMDNKAPTNILMHTLAKTFPQYSVFERLADLCLV